MTKAPESLREAGLARPSGSSQPGGDHGGRLGAPHRVGSHLAERLCVASVIAAVTAAREGLRVALLEPGDHLGGMVTGGLSATDHGEKQVVGGCSLEFYERLGRYYGREIEWYPEPHVAEKVLQEMVEELGTVFVFYQHRLIEQGGVRKE